MYFLRFLAAFSVPDGCLFHFLKILTTVVPFFENIDHSAHLSLSLCNDTVSWKLEVGSLGAKSHHDWFQSVNICRHSSEAASQRFCLSSLTEKTPGIKIVVEAS